ncbi:retrovirus-related Pol polyprotein from transposon 17.6 [Trichonephila clavipes]|nr:retrovirus-related Pol polyprotein from transposon 17.6 [Trichonephila clavipes]
MIRGPDMCNYSSINRAPIPKKGSERNLIQGLLRASYASAPVKEIYISSVSQKWYLVSKKLRQLRNLVMSWSSKCPEGPWYPRVSRVLVRRRVQGAEMTQTGIRRHSLLPTVTNMNLTDYVFRFKNSPKAFQSIAQEVLGDLLHNGALVYIDDIILFTKTIDEHFELLGFVVTPEGILIDKDKSVSINEFPVPRDQKQIKSFLGCCNFYRRYIKNFAKRALPLTNLLRKDTPFEWTSETQEAFDDIKKAILNPPVLALPDQNAELQITTDASSRGIGAVLEQKYPNSEVFTDHKPLAGFLSNKNPSSKILRWKLALEEFNYDIHYIRGSLNSVADHLSRYINNITIALPNSKDLINMQREDSVLSTIIQKIDQNDVSPQISNYFINGEGLSCHLSKRPSRSPRSNTTRKQVCIPHCLKAKILESVHSEYGGHLKFFKTYHRLSENFFWHNMYKDTKHFVRSCTICLSRKTHLKFRLHPINL